MPLLDEKCKDLTAQFRAVFLLEQWKNNLSSLFANRIKLVCNNASKRVGKESQMRFIIDTLQNQAAWCLRQEIHHL